MEPIKPFVYSAPINGVRVKPLSHEGREISILYCGRLAKSGSGPVFVHFGYGSNEKWTAIGELPLTKSEEGWEGKAVIKEGNQINFCFKDKDGNWDNNNGRNWIYRIS